MSERKELLAIVKFSGSPAITRPLRFILLIGCAMIVSAYGLDGQGQASDTARAGATAVGNAEAVIVHPLELRSNGAIVLDMLQISNHVQIDRQDCDAELERLVSECTFLIYELQ